MTFRKCACGCGKWFEVNAKHQKYYANHRHNYYNNIKNGKEGVIVNKNMYSLLLLTPSQRWEVMTLAQIGAEEKRLHKTYGQIQSMYYNGTLPEDFGIGSPDVGKVAIEWGRSCFGKKQCF